jgi:hypothetical protein
MNKLPDAYWIGHGNSTSDCAGSTPAGEASDRNLLPVAMGIGAACAFFAVVVARGFLWMFGL